MNGGGGKGKEWKGRYASRNFKNKNKKCTINSKGQKITKFPKNQKSVAHRKNQVDRDGGSVVYKVKCTIRWIRASGDQEKGTVREVQSHQRETFVKKLFGIEKAIACRYLFCRRIL